METSNNKFKKGLVIGRFQPFHKGHEFLINQSLKLCEQIIIGIGSANKKSKINPWRASERREVLKEFVKQNRLGSRVIKIINLYDNPNDDVWFFNLIKKTGPFDVTIGNNDWNNGIIERHGIPAIKPGFSNRNIWEGVKIRDLMNNKKSWEDRVPDYVITLIKKT